MHLSRLKRKVLAVAVTVAGVAGLAIGLTGTAGAVPAAPPGTQWAQIYSGCLARPPVASGDRFVSAGGRCTLSQRAVGGGASGQPFQIVYDYGTIYTVYTLVVTGPVDRAPIGFLDECNATTVRGWAKDPDWTGSLDVHLYNQNGFVKVITAGDASEPGTLGTNQRFTALHDQAPGSVLTVYEIGRDAAGGANGVNPALSRSVVAGTTCVVP